MRQYTWKATEKPVIKRVIKDVMIMDVDLLTGVQQLLKTMFESE